MVQRGEQGLVQGLSRQGLVQRGGTNNSSSVPLALLQELSQVRSISKVMVEYQKFTDSSLFKTVPLPLLQFLSTVIKTLFNFTQDIKRAPKT